jgi:hypothetical protein
VLLFQITGEIIQRFGVNSRHYLMSNDMNIITNNEQKRHVKVVVVHQNFSEVLKQNLKTPKIPVPRVLSKYPVRDLYLYIQIRDKE